MYLFISRYTKTATTFASIQQWEFYEITFSLFVRVQCTRTRMRTCTAWWGAPRRSYWSLLQTPPSFLMVSSGIIIIFLMSWFKIFLHRKFLFTVKKIVNTFILEYNGFFFFLYRNVSSCEVYRERWRVSGWDRRWHGRGIYRVCVCVCVGYWARNSSYVNVYCLKTTRQTNGWNRRLN